uniref:EF-hand domain-containing protein n=1 Tax=Oryza barthii TaxID=65489 RepID=A0A0D3GW99_9ORYZ
MASPARRELHDDVAVAIYSHESSASMEKERERERIRAREREGLIGFELCRRGEEMDAKQSVAAAKPSLAKKTASASFRLRNGSLNAVRLRREVLKKLGLPEAGSLATVREMICNVDRNSDGRVDFGEFKSMMQGITVWGP